MSVPERQNQFEARLKEIVGPSGAVTFQGGISNAARVVSGGIIFGVPNLANLSTDRDSFTCASRICLLPELEFYLAIHFREHLPVFRARLASLIEGINNTTICAGETGLCYLSTSKRDQPATGWLDNPPPPELGEGIPVDKIYFAVFANDLSNRSRAIFESFLGRIHSLFGESKVEEVQVWESSPKITEAMRKMPETITIDTIENRIRGLGGEYGKPLLTAFHTALNFLPRRHFVILTGISGTGKTSLVRRYAYAIHGISSLSEENPLFFTCRVRPEWTDPTGLLGYYDVFSKQYVVPPFLQALIMANSFNDSPVFVLLDEMNLARVEYYFADILSIFETPEEKLHLHSSRIPFRGDTGVEVPSSIPWPSNLYIIGAINIDETTNMPSPKVLDRATVIDMSQVDLDAFVARLIAREQGLAETINFCIPTLKEIHAEMSSHGLGFGYRATEEVIRYVYFVRNQDASQSDRAFDEQICQKLLIKLKGTHEQQGLLDNLLTKLGAMENSKAVLLRLQKELGEFGSFQAVR